jgi:hypothetical protein
VGSFMKLLMGAEDGAAATQAIRKAFMDIDRAKYAPATEDDGSEGQLLCDIQFSLAYGGLLLLNHTNLKLRRGRRYGICAGNGAGKSTLMKAIRDGKVGRHVLVLADASGRGLPFPGRAAVPHGRARAPGRGHVDDHCRLCRL